jgi:hypothetical protein
LLQTLEVGLRVFAPAHAGDYIKLRSNKVSKTWR